MMNTTAKNISSSSDGKRVPPNKTIRRLLGLVGLLGLLCILVALVLLWQSLPKTTSPENNNTLVKVDTYKLFSLAKKGNYLSITNEPANKWEQYFQKILAHCDKQLPNADDKEKALLYRYKGHAYQMLGKHEVAKAAFTTSIDLLTINKKQTELALAEALYQKAYRIKEDKERIKIVWYDYVDWLYQRNSSENRLSLLSKIARICRFHLSQYRDALHVLEELLMIYQQGEAKYKKKIAEIWNKKGRCYRWLAQYEKALKCHNRAIKIHEKQLDLHKEKIEQTQIQQAIVDTELYKGDVYKDMKKYKKSMECYHTAKDWYNKHAQERYEYKENIASITRKLIRLHEEQENYNEALDCLDDLEKLYKALTNAVFSFPQEYFIDSNGKPIPEERVMKTLLYARLQRDHITNQTMYKHKARHLWNNKVIYHTKLKNYQKAIELYDKEIAQIATLPKDSKIPANHG
ncbi:MAG: tetratricopeptide repeat protein, partial [Bacteroidota bacterium]